MADDVRFTISADDQASEQFESIVAALTAVVQQSLRQTNRLTEAQKRLKEATDKPDKAANLALKNAIEFRKAQIKYTNKLTEAQDKLTRESSEYLSILDRIRKSGSAK